MGEGRKELENIRTDRAEIKGLCFDAGWIKDCRSGGRRAAPPVPYVARGSGPFLESSVGRYYVEIGRTKSGVSVQGI